MNKIKVLLLLCLVITVTGVSYDKIATFKEPLSADALRNIEALASGEVDGDCDNENGYRRILEGNERIYDCCYVEQVGKGKEDCKRW